MLYGRSAIVTAAHAYGLQAIDLVSFIQDRIGFSSVLMGHSY